MSMSMSYNYNELVGKIVESRKVAVKEASVSKEDRLTFLELCLEHFETLSEKCPMTPLLWMLYALDASQLSNMAMDQDCNAELLPSSIQMALQILQLGLQQFPGSSILHLLQIQFSRKLFVKKKEEEEEDDDGGSSLNELKEKYLEILENSVQQIGSGSHRNEGVIVKQIYDEYCESFLQRYSGLRISRGQRKHMQAEAILDSFTRRAKIPMNGDFNSSILQDYQDFCQDHDDVQEFSPASRQLEEARRYESKTFSFLQTFEDDVTIAMQQEGILSEKLQSESLEENPWDDISKNILQDDVISNSNSWMGMGGMQTAQAFINYAQACSRYKNKEDTEVEETIHALTTKVYERGVAECPTVETLWMSYLKQLHYWMRQEIMRKEESWQDQYITLLEQAKAVVDRAVRNCPYSVALVQEKLNLILLQANSGIANLDPEELYKTFLIKETIGNGFIVQPPQILELFLTVTKVVRGRILVFLHDMAPVLVEETTKKNKKKKSKPIPTHYDDPESMAVPTIASQHDLDDEQLQELEDLCTDLREIYDDMDEYIRKNHQKYKEGRAKLWEDRGWTETHLVAPIMQCFDEEGGESTSSPPSVDTKRYEQVIKSFDKATKVSLPVHPSVFVEYIQAILASYPVTTAPYLVMYKLRQVRQLYQTALKSVGKPKDKGDGASNATTTTSHQPLDYETALRVLCQDYVTFEQYFGSENSVSDATKAVQKKLSRAFANGVQPPQDYDGAADANTDSTSQKRKADDANGDENAMEIDGESPEPSTKKQKTDPTATSQKATTLSVPKPTQHKVQVGNVEYPAHPFTIRVSFLSPKTQDMDLVDVFRPKCGPIVHAKIMRDKHHSPHEKGKSKGWGLVQFEDLESVEKALALSDVIGLDEKSVKIERSHLPAVGLVPSGMHRVNPRGHGKSTKRNQKRKEHQRDSKGAANEEDGSKKPAAAPPAPASSTTTASTLSLRPRVVSKKAKPKSKISIGRKDG